MVSYKRVPPTTAPTMATNPTITLLYSNMATWPAAALEVVAAADPDPDALPEPALEGEVPLARLLVPEAVPLDAREVVPELPETEPEAVVAADPLAETETEPDALPDALTAAHSDCWRAAAACCSSAVQVDCRQEAAASWNAVLVQIHVRSVRVHPFADAACSEQVRTHAGMVLVSVGTAADETEVPVGTTVPVPASVVVAVSVVLSWARTATTRRPRREMTLVRPCIF